MDRVSGTRRRLSVVAGVSAVLALALGVTGVAVAAPVTFDLNYSTLSGLATAVGTFTVDSTLLVPNTHIDGGTPGNLDYLLCFNLVVMLPTGLPLTFTKADLHGWTFVTEDASANIGYVNFFMECGSHAFIIDGLAPLDLGVFQCPNEAIPIAAFEAHPAQGGVCEADAAVPALSLPGLVALVLLVAVGAIFALRRGAALG